VNARAFGRKGRIRDNTVSLIDHTGRVLQAIEQGNWHYAGEKLHQLRRTIDQLAAEVDLTKHAEELRQIPREQVWTEVGHSAGTHYWLGRLIFRKGGDGRG
jgi:cobalamin biosynthesis Mg chelatase CobN